MRVVLLSEFFSKGTGYLENMLPKYLARLGVEVHVVATSLRPYNSQLSVGQPFEHIFSQLEPGSIEVYDGYTLHVLKHRRILGYTKMANLLGTLRAVGPDVVQTMAVTGWIPLDAAVFRPFLNYKLFTGCHHHASVFPLARQGFGIKRVMSILARAVPGWLVSRGGEKCYAISEDCAEIATRFLGVPLKNIDVCPLGVDTDVFHPISSEEDQNYRKRLREQFGFGDGDVVCIYTGRFSPDKNPLLLAGAIDKLTRAGTRFRGLFVGDGAQLTEILECEGCVVHPFVPVFELGKFYRSAEIGVWPTQESMAMLDAAACGIPIVVNDTMTAQERIASNGVVYRLGDLEDLTRKISQLGDIGSRKNMGLAGARKMALNFSWQAIATRRLRDYESASVSSGSLAKGADKH